MVDAETKCCILASVAVDAAATLTLVDDKQVVACWPQQLMKQARKLQLMFMMRQVVAC